jgi:hypothetical protein
MYPSLHVYCLPLHLCGNLYDARMCNRPLPSWMFIQWMPQMLAALSEAPGALYSPVLVRYISSVLRRLSIS